MNEKLSSTKITFNLKKSSVEQLRILKQMISNYINKKLIMQLYII